MEERLPNHSYICLPSGGKTTKPFLYLAAQWKVDYKTISISGCPVEGRLPILYLAAQWREDHETNPIPGCPCSGGKITKPILYLAAYSGGKTTKPILYLAA